MSESGYKSLYSVFIFILAFSIINFYATKMKDERRFRIENQKIKDYKLLEQIKNDQRMKQHLESFKMCYDYQQFNCLQLEVFTSTLY